MYTYIWLILSELLNIFQYTGAHLLMFDKGDWLVPVSEFNEFKPRLKSHKNRFQWSADLNLEKLIQIQVETTKFDPQLKFKPRLKFFKFGLWTPFFCYRIFLIILEDSLLSCRHKLLLLVATISTFIL